MLVIGKKIPLVGFILNEFFRYVTFDTKKVTFYLCEDLIKEREVKI